jgi:uncharacterized protein (DUF2336 family)
LTQPLPAAAPLDLAEPVRAGSRARAALFKRLADVVCLPASRVNTFERSVTADLLVDMLRDADQGERERVARRLARLTEIPPPLLRLLLNDVLEVARPLLEECTALGDADLVDCIRRAGADHRRLIAMRRGLSELVCEALVEPMESTVVEPLLRNGEARLAPETVHRLLAASRDHAPYATLLLKRHELRPHHAYTLFWWAPPEARRTILQRFAVSREVLQDAAGDVFAMAANEGWSDPVARKALQFIERRQRNRMAIEKSPFASLDDACAAAERGMNRELAEEVGYLSGVKPTTAAKIFTDPGGEGVAILCKATGLPREAVRQLWRGLRRPEVTASGELHPSLERVLITYDMLAVDRAQTVLRYWNWSLSSALNPALLRAIRSGDADGDGGLGSPQRAAALALGPELGG